MKNRLQISIPEPCHENWDKMTPTKQGRFCDVCSKCVVDFTRFSDGELLAYFSNPPKNLCGRFDNKKLNTVISSSPTTHFSLAKRLFWGLAMVAGVGTTLNAQTTAINNTPTTEQEPFYNNDTILQSPQTTSDTIGVIKGVLLDSATNEPLVGASIFIKGSKIGASTDLNGKYSLKLPKEYLNKPLTIEVHYIGYTTLQYTEVYYNRDKERFSKIYMTESTLSCTVGAVVYYKPTRWQRIKGFFRRLF